MSTLAKREAIAAAAEMAAAEIHVETEKARQGRDALDSLRNLTFIEARLKDIAKMLREDAVPQDPRFKGSIGRLIVDTWPLRHPLGERIAKVEYDFERLKV